MELLIVHLGSTHAEYVCSVFLVSYLLLCVCDQQAEGLKPAHGALCNVCLVGLHRSSSGPCMGSARMHKDAEHPAQAKRQGPTVTAAELQQLAEKQAACQHSPPSHVSLLTQQVCKH